jgi:hypothetical protein
MSVTSWNATLSSQSIKVPTTLSLTSGLSTTGRQVFYTFAPYCSVTYPPLLPGMGRYRPSSIFNFVL